LRVDYPSATRGLIRDFCAETGVLVDFQLDESAWQCAADAFASDAQRPRRSQGGAPKRLLVDFLIAAHALLRADRLMTLDPSRYQQDFPKLRLNESSGKSARAR